MQAFQRLVGVGIPGENIEPPILTSDDIKGIDLQRLDKKTGFTLLHLSCLWGSLENVMFLVGHGGSLLQRTRDGDSCLHLAAGEGHKAVVEYLLSKGADPNVKDRAGLSPLHGATLAGDVPCMCSLIRAGAELYTPEPTSGMTPLHYAAMCVNEDNRMENPTSAAQLCAALLNSGARQNTELTDRLGRTPLHLAAANGNSEALQLLLQHGYQPNVRTKKGESPLLMAARQGHEKCVKLLLEHGADTTVRDSRGRSYKDLQSAHDLLKPRKGVFGGNGRLPSWFILVAFFICAVFAYCIQYAKNRIIPYGWWRLAS